MRNALNFNAGPSALPIDVLREAQQNLLDFNGTGMSIMELSHRSDVYGSIQQDAKSLLQKLLDIPPEFDILFLQGGASLQFSMIPMNLLSPNQTAYYILSGVWAEKAFNEAKKNGKTAILASSKDKNYNYIPSNFSIPDKNSAAFVHLTSNNTIYGTEWRNYPSFPSIPLVADMSSDLLSKKIDINQFDLIYAGAQKNLGTAGVTVVFIRKSLLERSKATLPAMLNYQIHSQNQSLYNTPPTFSIYILYLVLKWIDQMGGVNEMEKLNIEKATTLYETIDKSNGFFIGHAENNSRSRMNVTFNLVTEELTQKFLQEALDYGFIGLNGHRSIGGCRVSIYNAVPLSHVQILINFMDEFRRKLQ
ncbi:phosphoserine transaminase [Neobacillus sp. D3-1R]|uniref:phosphoserine transaminase n=1 Tax=Neobacillus sp. D3-1R TaxID=3445778 RepID=UPI003FA09E7A